jgi:hypothetical protein
LRPTRRGQQRCRQAEQDGDGAPSH